MIAFSRRFWNLASVMSGLVFDVAGAAAGGGAEGGVAAGGCVAVWANAVAVSRLKAAARIERRIMLASPVGALPRCAVATLLPLNAAAGKIRR
jgi:hypothetical protein